MLKSNKTNYILILLLTIFMGCNNMGDSGLNIKEAAIKVSLPKMALGLYEDLDAMYNSRAFGVIDVAKFKLYSGDTLVEIYEINLSGLSFDDEPGSTLLVAPEGVYTLSVDIFNNDNSLTEAVVSGVSNTFTVVANEIVNVYITTFPNNPVELTESVTYSLSSTEFVPTVYEGLYYVIPGSEKWFKFTASTDDTLIDFPGDFVEDNMGFGFSLFKENGEHIDITSNESINTVAGDTYYFVVLFCTFDQELTSTMDIDFEIKPFEEIDDGNDSMSLAVLVPTDSTVIEGQFEKYNDSDYFKFNALAGHEYTFDYNNSGKTEVLFMKSDGTIISINTLDSGNYLSDFYYRCLEDETLYINTSPKFDNTVFSYSLSITDTGIYDLDFEINVGGNFSIGKDIVVSLLRLELDESYTEISTTIVDYKSEYSSFSGKFPSVDNLDNLFFFALLKDADGNVIAFQNEYTPLSFEIPTISIFNNSPTLSMITATNASITLGSEWVSDSFAWSDEDYTNELSLPTFPLVLSVSFNSKPESSILTDDVLEITSESGTDFITFTPDVSGYYDVLISVSDGVNETIKILTCTAIAANEGEINVVFE